MIRKFNYTGRRKIPRSAVSFQLSGVGAGSFSFEASLSLKGLHLPPEAEVFVEAYRGASLMRFPYGCAGNPTAPDRTVLEQLSPGGIPLFRVKVVLDGRIIASVDRIVPRLDVAEPHDRLCLLPVEFVELGDLVWQLDLSDARPILQVNAAIEGIREIVRSDTHFFSLVYPEIVRQILRHILIRENYDDDECDPDDWQSHWIRFVEDLPGVSPLPARTVLTTEQDKEFWIGNAVLAFCRKWRVCDRFGGSAGEEK
ncbi:MAG: hypothetical protein GX423_04390 [Nitrospiraceae bacterium]|jgi:hypothetical protein|nr:hypothetical protein [Nitrospiraceae bacterium]